MRRRLILVTPTAEGADSRGWSRVRAPRAERPCPVVALDVGAVEVMPVQRLAGLVRLRRLFQTSGGDLFLVGGDNLQRELLRTGLDRSLPCFQSLEVARATLTL